MIKVCEWCGKDYEPTMKHGLWKRQKFCSRKCGVEKWNTIGSEEAGLKEVIICQFCGDPLSENENRPDRPYHKECKKKHSAERVRDFAKKAGREFRKMKKTVGCQFCGYNKYGGSLDFHHFEGKDRRIDAPGWWLGHQKTWAEMEKCILLCKNCHFEFHGEMT